MFSCSEFKEESCKVTAISCTGDCDLATIEVASAGLLFGDLTVMQVLSASLY